MFGIWCPALECSLLHDSHQRHVMKRVFDLNPPDWFFSNFFIHNHKKCRAMQSCNAANIRPIYLISCEESSLWEWVWAALALEAGAVKVDVINTQDLSRTFLPAALAIGLSQKFEGWLERSEAQILFLFSGSAILGLGSFDRIGWLHCHHFIWQPWSLQLNQIGNPESCLKGNKCCLTRKEGTPEREVKN
jgi:hypothetical protein